MTIWCLCAELYLYHNVGGNFSWKDKLIEFIMMLMFVVSSSFGSLVLFILIYGLSFGCLLLLDRKRYLQLLKEKI